MTRQDITEEKHCWHCAINFDEPYLDSPLMELAVSFTPEGSKEVTETYWKCTQCGFVAKFMK